MQDLSSIDAEKSVLGTILVDSKAMEKVVDTLHPYHFYLPQHQLVYKALEALYVKGYPTDLLMTKQWLTDRNLIELAGGSETLIAITQSYVIGEDIEKYAQTIVEKAACRKMVEIGNFTISIARNPSSLEERVDLVERKAFELRDLSSPSRGMIDADRAAVDLSQEMESAIALGSSTLTSTGFYDLDELLGGGFGNDELIIIGARPGVGKTSVTGNIAYNIASKYSEWVLIFNLEMSVSELMKRYVSKIGRIPLKELIRWKLTPMELGRFAAAVDTISSLPISFDDNPYITVESIRSKLRKRIASGEKVRLVIVDYLQLIADPSKGNMVDIVGDITRKLKLLAKECKVPILLLSQLNRGSEHRTDKRPTMSDLRASGRIEEDANIVLLLHRDDPNDPNNSRKNILDVFCTKNRRGETGTIELLFEGHFCNILNKVNQH